MKQNNSENNFENDYKAAFQTRRKSLPGHLKYGRFGNSREVRKPTNFFAFDPKTGTWRDMSLIAQRYRANHINPNLQIETDEQPVELDNRTMSITGRALYEQMSESLESRRADMKRSDSFDISSNEDEDQNSDYNRVWSENDIRSAQVRSAFIQPENLEEARRLWANSFILPREDENEHEPVWNLEDPAELFNSPTSNRIATTLPFEQADQIQELRDFLNLNEQQQERESSTTWPLEQSEQVQRIDDYLADDVNQSTNTASVSEQAQNPESLNTNTTSVTISNIWPLEQSEEVQELNSYLNSATNGISATATVSTTLPLEQSEGVETLTDYLNSNNQNTAESTVSTTLPLEQSEDVQELSDYLNSNTSTSNFVNSWPLEQSDDVQELRDYLNTNLHETNSLNISNNLSIEQSNQIQEISEILTTINASTNLSSLEHDNLSNTATEETTTTPATTNIATTWPLERSEEVQELTAYLNMIDQALNNVQNVEEISSSNTSTSSNLDLEQSSEAREFNLNSSASILESSDQVIQRSIDTEFNENNGINNQNHSSSAALLATENFSTGYVQEVVSNIETLILSRKSSFRGDGTEKSSVVPSAKMWPLEPTESVLEFNSYLRNDEENHDVYEYHHGISFRIVSDDKNYKSSSRLDEDQEIGIDFNYVYTPEPLNDDYMFQSVNQNPIENDPKNQISQSQANEIVSHLDAAAVDENTDNTIQDENVFNVTSVAHQNDLDPINTRKLPVLMQTMLNENISKSNSAVSISEMENQNPQLALQLLQNEPEIIENSQVEAIAERQENSEIIENDETIEKAELDDDREDTENCENDNDNDDIVNEESIFENVSTSQQFDEPTVVISSQTAPSLINPNLIPPEIYSTLSISQSSSVSSESSGSDSSSSSSNNSEDVLSDDFSIQKSKGVKNSIGFESSESSVVNKRPAKLTLKNLHSYGISSCSSSSSDSSSSSSSSSSDSDSSSSSSSFFKSAEFVSTPPPLPLRRPIVPPKKQVSSSKKSKSQAQTQTPKLKLVSSSNVRTENQNHGGTLKLKSARADFNDSNVLLITSGTIMALIFIFLFIKKFMLSASAITGAISL